MHIKKINNYYIHESSYIDDDVQIGKDTKIWHYCHIQSGAKIGCNCNFGQNVNVANNVIIGNGCKIQNNVSIYQGVELEDFVFCGPSMVFTNDINPRAKYPKKTNSYLRTLVKEGATIGANATIMCGIEIGKYALIGAGTVVTKNVKHHAIVYGVPAVQKGWICECGEFLNEGLECLACGCKYIEKKDGLEMINK